MATENNVAALDLSAIAVGVAQTYVPTVHDMDELTVNIKTLATKIKARTDELEGNLLSDACLLVSDYIFFRVKDTGIFPKEKDIRSYFQNEMSLDVSGKTTKGTLAVVLSHAIKCGVLVFLETKTTFKVRWTLGARHEDEEFDGASRVVMYRKNAVYPNRKEGTGDKAFAVPEGNHYAFASQDSINLAYSHYINGVKRDDYGRPVRGVVASHDVTLKDASPDKLFHRVDEVARHIKLTNENKERLRNLKAVLAEKLGDDDAGSFEELPPTKVKLTDDQGNDLPLDVIMGIVRDELAEKSFIQHDERTQEMAVSLFDLLKGMLANVHGQKKAA